MTRESHGREKPRPPSARPGLSQLSPAAKTACAHTRAISIRVTGGGAREGAGPAGGVGARRARGRAPGEGAGPRRLRRAGRSRPMSGVHMPRRRREGRQRRINAIRAAAAEPSPTPPPVSTAAVSSAAVGGAELRGSCRRAAQLLFGCPPRSPPRRGLGRAPLLSRAGSPRRGLRCPRPAGS